jgi:hypothetical protein
MTQKSSLSTSWVLVSQHLKQWLRDNHRMEQTAHCMNVISPLRKIGLNTNWTITNGEGHHFPIPITDLLGATVKVEKFPSSDLNSLKKSNLEANS